ncbi:hypothetical protein ACLOJK_019673 [Asimina triloba]
MADAEFDPAVDPTTIPVNGVVGDGTEDQDAHITENKELKEKMKRLLEQIHILEKDLAAKEGRVEELLAEKNQAEETTEKDKKALEAISARAAQLETELFRLQHDYFSATSERDDLLGKLQTLEVALEEAERAKRERDSKIGILEQEAEERGEVFGRRIRELEEEMEVKVLEVRKAENDKAETEERLKQLDEKWEEFKLKNLEMEKTMVGWREDKLELEEKVVVLQRELEKEEGNNKKEKNLLNFAWATGRGGRTTTTTVVVASVATAAALFYLKYAKQGKGRD